MKKFYPERSRRAFALIYTLLFITLLLIAVSATWFTGMADLRLARSNEYSTEATQWAKAGVDDGWLKYVSLIGQKITYTDSEVTFPPSACGATSKVVRTNPNVNPVTTSTPNLQPAPPLSETIEGRYDYRVCTSGGTTSIEGIGYYKGNKITLKATVTHKDKELYGDILNPTKVTGLDHSDDYLTIYQAGPSK